jgi:succinate dehydrogenase / fumarate reductase cytochrome b subunit
MKRLLIFANSSIGKKAIMGTTGLFLCGFLVVHLSGNLLLFVGKDTFNAYAEALESKKALMYGAEVVLLCGFLYHIFLGLRLTQENRDARPVGYLVRRVAGGSTFASRTMLQTGSVVLVFLVLHIWTFKFGVEQGETLYDNVVRRFANPAYAFFYIFAVCVLGVHLSHGVQSAFQSVGLRGAGSAPVLKKIAWAFGLGVALGFSSFPLYFVMKGGQF